MKFVGIFVDVLMKFFFVMMFDCFFEDVVDVFVCLVLFLYIVVFLVMFWLICGIVVLECWVEGIFWFVMKFFGLILFGE